MAIPRKPVRNVEEFIRTAKVEEKEQTAQESSPEAQKVKKFLIELPYDLWKRLKLKAVQEGKSLKDLILEALREKAE